MEITIIKFDGYGVTNHDKIWNHVDKILPNSAVYRIKLFHFDKLFI